MDIKYLGHSSFKLQGSKAKVVTDPFDSSIVGIKFPKTDADIVTISHQHADHNSVDLIEGNPLVINIPGEYEKKGVRVTGFDSFHDNEQGKERGKNTIFKIEIDDISVLHCGDLGHTLTNEMIEEIGEVDVLLIPNGGVFTISADEAVVIARAIEPHIVVPMHYNGDGLNQQTFAQLSSVSVFLSAMGGQTVEPSPKLTIKKTDLTEENLRVVVLEF